MNKFVSLFIFAYVFIAATACGTDNGGVVDTDVGTDVDAVGDPDGFDGIDVSDAADVDAEPDTNDVADMDADIEPDGTVVLEWETIEIDNTPNFKSRAAIALGPDGSIHIAYNIATDPEGWYTPAVWYATNSTGTWTKENAAPAEGTSNEFPNIVVDSANRPHIFYNRYNPTEEQIDIFHVTLDDSMTFTAPVNVTQTTDRDEFAPDVFIDGGDSIHLLVQVRTGTPELGYNYSMGYLRTSGASVVLSEEVAADTASPGLNPAYALCVDDGGNVHALYSRPGSWDLNFVLHYRMRNASSWESEERLIEENEDIFSPSIDVDGNGHGHAVYVLGPDLSTKTLYYNRREGGSWVGEQALSTSTEDRSYYLGLDVEQGGRVHIAYKRFFDGNGDIFYLAGAAGLFEEEVRITDTAAADEGTPAIAVDADTAVYILFTENISDAPNGVVYLATGREVVVP